MGGATGDGGHAPDVAECKSLRTILRALEGRGQSTGKLFTDLRITKERADFDVLLEGLARAGLIEIANDTFTNPEGKEITYRKATITHEGRDPDDATLATVWIRGSVGTSKSSAKKVKKPAVADRALTAEEEALEKRIWAWRSALAKKSGAPAFTIFADSTMRALVIQNPRTMADLRTIKGLGPVKVEKLGAEILTVCRGEGAAEVEPSERFLKPATKPVPAKAVAVNASEARPSVRATVHVSESRRVVPKAVVAPQVVELSAAQMELEEKLRLWRREEAAKSGLPSFFVFSDTVLRSVVLAKPATVAALEGVKGVGREKAEKFGAAVVALCWQGLPTAENATRYVNVQSPSSLYEERRRIAAEDLKPLAMKTRAGRKRSLAYDESANRLMGLEDDLRTFISTQAELLRQSPEHLLSEAALADLIRFRPQSIDELKKKDHIRGDLPPSFYEGLLRMCQSEYEPERKTEGKPKAIRNAVDDIHSRTR